MKIKHCIAYALVAFLAAVSTRAQESWTPWWVYDVTEYGATGNGSTDDSNAIRNCINAAIATKGSGTGPVRAEVIFPPGRYRITQNDVLMSASDGNNNGVYGLKIRGFGKDVTTILFQPTTTSTTDPFVGNLFSARKRARYFHISDMTFDTGVGGSTVSQASCFYFFGDGQGSNMNQANVFERLNFRGNWKRCFGFDGDSDANLNSEMTFRNISGHTARYTDAFMRVGGISGLYNQQNQFLNYWFYDSNFVLDGGTLFRFDKGGAANFINGSWSASSSTAPAMTFISMPNTNFNNTSAAQFRFENIRFEPKASNHTVINCSLGQGSVTFESCVDLSSIQTTASNSYPLHIYNGANPWGFTIHPTVRYINCHMAGYHQYTGPSSSATRGWFIYEGCYFFRGTSGQTCTATTAQGGSEQALRWSSGTGAPRYTFKSCWNITNI